MEENHRWAAETVHLTQPVSAYEGMTSDTISYLWNPDMVLYYQDRFVPLYVLVSAWQEVPKSAIDGVLDTIRTRVLNMALEIRAEVGESDANLTGITPDSQEANKVDQTINNNIFGGTNYFATGQSRMNATTVQQNIVAGDWEQLKKILRNSGLADSELDELSDAVKHDGGTMGSGVKGWISKNGMKVLSGGVKIGAAVGQSVLTAYLKQHFGLDQ